MFLTSKYNKIALVSLIFVLSFLIMAQVGLAISLDGSAAANKGLIETAKEGYGWEGILQENSSLPIIIGKIIGTALSFLGVVFFGIILYAGIGWILSLGNEEKITEAKNMIIAAVLGLIVVLGAYAITNVVAQIFNDSTQVNNTTTQ